MRRLVKATGRKFLGVERLPPLCRGQMIAWRRLHGIEPVSNDFLHRISKGSEREDLHDFQDSRSARISNRALMPLQTMCSPVANSQQVAKLACIMLRMSPPGGFEPQTMFTKVRRSNHLATVTGKSSSRYSH